MSKMSPLAQESIRATLASALEALDWDYTIIERDAEIIFEPHQERVNWHFLTKEFVLHAAKTMGSTAAGHRLAAHIRSTSKQRIPIDGRQT